MWRRWGNRSGCRCRRGMRRKCSVGAGDWEGVKMETDCALLEVGGGRVVRARRLGVDEKIEERDWIMTREAFMRSMPTDILEAYPVVENVGKVAGFTKTLVVFREVRA